MIARSCGLPESFHSMQEAQVRCACAVCSHRRCIHVAYLPARQTVSASLVESNAKDRTVMSSQDEGLIDRKAFSILCPRRGKHVICF